jgi:hypothetical protein
VITRKSTKRFGVLASSILAVGLGAIPAFANTLYNDIPVTDVSGAPETTSWASFANGTNSFGSLIVPAQSGTAFDAEVMLSNYATASQYGGVLGGSYNANLTFNLYAVNPASPGDSNAAPGTGYDLTNPANTTLLGSFTQNFNINYRPEANAGATPGDCGAGNSDAYLAGVNTFSCGQLQAVDFGLGGLPIVAGQSYIWTAALNGGASDAGAQSLNWALNNLSQGNISATSNPQYDTNYLNGVVNTGWASIGQGEVNLSDTPEPTTFGLIGLGLLGLGVSVRKKSRKI